MKECFLDKNRLCEDRCMAFDVKTAGCRILGAMDRLVPPPSRPVAPTMPPKVKT